MTKEEAIQLAKSDFWKHLDSREIVEFQIYEEKLCMPWEVFHKAVNEVLGRPVYTHEFASSNINNLRMELMGEKTPPSIQEIMELIPEEKRIIIS